MKKGEKNMLKLVSYPKIDILMFSKMYQLYLHLYPTNWSIEQNCISKHRRCSKLYYKRSRHTSPFVVGHFTF